MSTPDQRVEVFKDTLAWIEADKDLSESIPVAKKNTEVFYEDDYPDFDSTRIVDTKISVTKSRSYEAAMRLHKEDPQSKIAVMNFANAFHAGGGVTKGASAQEECLCRTSTLYPLLYRRTLRDTFYKHHHTLNTPKASDSLIYTEGVIICKTDDDIPQRMPKENWVTVDVITIAAPDLRSSSNKYAALVGDGTFMNNAELFGYHVKRAIHMLTVAASKGADTLVLGAFGCGAFQNDPEVVARAYKVALQEFPKVFRRVEFAVYCSPKDKRNYEIFKQVLSQRKSREIVCFADKWRGVFLDDNFNPYAVTEDQSFPEDCRSFGFDIVPDEFNRLYPGAYDNWEKLERIALQVEDVQVIGNAIFHKWRYYNHWAYSASEIADPDVKKWFVIALDILKEVSRKE